MKGAAKPSLALVESYQPQYSEITIHYDEQYEAAWCYMHSTPRPCFSLPLLSDLNEWCAELKGGTQLSRGEIRYHVLASDVPGIFNLGGDLSLFSSLVKAKDRAALYNYSEACIEALYSSISHFDQDITTISLVQGDALGGGFETAMSSDVLIAERSAKMGLPEILFNLFPGMGAYSLLSRKIGPSQAERMILSGRIYTAKELHEMGVVDVLAEDYQGELAVYDYIKRENRASNGYRALRAAKNRVNPITHRELMEITEIWVDAALKLDRRDLRMMERLVVRQSSLEKRELSGQ